ncbi:MAG: hypothetical protein JNJ61_25135 [Anaerolineae bacterium]|nr:hypothetical protein [Anaerolineae bacterium]
MTEGFVVEQQGHITIHRFTESSDKAVNAWRAALISQFESDQPFAVLLDVSAKQVSFTAYARQTTKALFSQYRMRQGRFACLFSSRTAPYYARIFFASLGRLNFAIGTFSSRDAALEWLRRG